MLPESFSFINRFQKYDGNPILRPQGEYAADCIFNPGAVVKDGEVWLLCRCINFNTPKPEQNWSVSSLVWAKSRDGLSFQLDDKPFLFPTPDSEYPGGFEDPRLVWLPEEQLYMLTYTGVRNLNTTPGMAAFSKDLVHWDFIGECFPARAVAVTNCRINGKYWAYYGNSSIFLAWSDDLRHWETDRKPVISPRQDYFDASLCEAASAPVITDDGILLIYNGAARDNFKKSMYTGKYCLRAGVNDHVYSIGWVLLDRNDPSKVIDRADVPFLMPELPYELYGIAEYTTFGEALVQLNGKWYLYYGCSDTRIAVAVAMENDGGAS